MDALESMQEVAPKMPNEPYTQNQTDRLLRAEEAAALLEVSAATFRHLVARGQMPVARQLGGRRRWLLSELITALRQLPTQANRGVTP